MKNFASGFLVTKIKENMSFPPTATYNFFNIFLCHNFRYIFQQIIAIRKSYSSVNVFEFVA